MSRHDDRPWTYSQSQVNRTMFSVRNRSGVWMADTPYESVAKMLVTPDDTAELVALLQLARNNIGKMYDCEADERDVQQCLSRIDAVIKS